MPNPLSGRPDIAIFEMKILGDNVHCGGRVLFPTPGRFRPLAAGLPARDANARPDLPTGAEG